jgi:hypothetical protein
VRGQYGSPRVSSRYVGVGALYHSVGDRAEAVKQLAVDWTALYQNLASQVGEITPDPKSSSGYHITTQREWDAAPPDSKKVEWWKSSAKPIFNTWVKFKSEQLGDRTVASDYIAFAERWQTDWDVYERWKKKLDALRTEAHRRGFAVSAPLAAELPTTIWSDVARGAGDVVKGAGDTWTFIKYAAWAVLGIGTIVALSSVAQNLRVGKDPAERYAQLFRQRGRAVVRAAMPPPVRLVLPPGSSSMGGV